ncbi:MAG: acetate--CoA ligase family protein [Acidobacteria bacterium]|nr:acetate--CoA ligase family protein [Acidobacteriota bacterium]
MSMSSSTRPVPAALLPAAIRPVARLLAPQSIAIVGASADARSFGGFVLGNLRRFGYAGRVHLVSRSSREIEGLACVASVDELPEDIDVAVLAVPEQAVADAVRGLAARRCHAAVVFASGYAETGEAGQARQGELARAAGAMAVVGPNCMGYTRYPSDIALTFESLAPPAEPLPAEGGISIVAQSGFMAATLRDAFLGRGLPVATVFSTGNECSLGVEDLLAAYADDPATRIVALYAEQIRRPSLALALIRRAGAAGKPVVVLMPGRSARARAAAASHTGALAGDHATASALLARAGAVLVDSLDELFDATAVLLHRPRPPAGGTAFVTGSGAMKNLALDFAEAVNLALPALGETTRAALADKLPSFAVAENPLDYTTIGVRQPGLIGEIIETIAADPAIASIVLAIPVGPVIAQRDKAEHIVPALARVARQSGKPTLLVLTGDASRVEPFFLEAIAASGVPLFRSAERALRALAQVARFGARLAAIDAASGSLRSGVSPGDGAAAVPLPGPRPPNGIYAEAQGKQWLAACGISVPRGRLARSADEAAAIAREIGWPVVLKAQSSELPHKSDAGGVLVGLADEAALRAGYARVLANVAAARPGLVLDGLLVEAMGARGIELVVGARRDGPGEGGEATAWGPVLMVGLGGIWIEVLKDVQLLAAEADEDEIVAALGRLKAAPLLAGVRGAPPVDVRAIARVVAALGSQMLANPSIAEVDINPLVATPSGALALDALLMVAPPSARDATRDGGGGAPA